MDTKQFLSGILDEFNKIDYVKPDDIPNIDLYMDQVMQLFESKLSYTKRNNDDKVLTKTMINNYAKANLLMKIRNKKYTKDHLILMGLIYNLKGGLSLTDIKTMFTPIIEAFDNPEYKAELSNVVLTEMRDKVLIASSGMAGYGSSNEIKTTKVMKNFYLCGDRVTDA